MPNKQYGKNYKASCKKYVRHNLNDMPYNLNYIRHCLKPIKPFGNEMLINCLYATITIFQSVIQFSTHHGKAFRKHRREKTRAYRGGTPYDVLKSFAVDFLPNRQASNRISVQKTSSNRLCPTSPLERNHPGNHRCVSWPFSFLKHHP